MAPLVIIRAGQGDGLLWECEQAFGMLSPHQLVILVLEIRADEYQHFATAVHARLGVVVPAIPSFFVLRFLWNPQPVLAWSNLGSLCSPKDGVPSSYPFRPARSLVKPFREALRPVFAAHGVSEK